ncbi:unnamed protein product [Linum trigynum]|uniref:CCHC-type domain-containing protein n=1 Tax=Linum trigynum TaxID=586398 RepID=A0AAV2DXP2_9ROSI
MYSRFTTLINKLKGLGKIFLVKDLNRKILRLLPKRTAIVEAKNLATLPINELIGSLLSHENVIKQVNQDDDKRHKSLAFKSKVIAYDSGSENEAEFDKEFALVSKQFHRMLKHKNNRKLQASESQNFEYDRTKPYSQDRLPLSQTRKFETGFQDKEPQACCKCGKLGHIRAQCTLTLRAREHAKKASWSSYDSGQDNVPSDE